MALATVLTFWPVVGHGFLNWDDPDVVAANPRLASPPGALVAWALTTREMGHYQPLSWLALAGVAGQPAAAARVHGAAIALHALNALLLMAVAAALVVAPSAATRWAAAGLSALLFAVHPLRVEPVAWASALPYLLSYAPLLAAVGAWIAYVRRGGAVWLGTSVALFVVSQLARVTAPLLPVVLAALAAVDLRARPRPLRAWMLALLPFAVVAAALAAVEAGAREVETLTDIPLLPRLAWALTHPAQYLVRLVASLAPNPLDAIPRVPQARWGEAALAVAGLAALVAVTARVWSWRIAAAVWGSYLALLAPVAGLFPSGLQLTADRYTYGPAMVLSIALAVAIAGAGRVVRRTALAAGAVAALVFAVAAHAQTGWWRDSPTLWARALALDADNDVARYNLALAELDAGRIDAGVAHLERLIADVPDHAPARTRLDAIVADREMAAADAAADAGRLADAVAGYSRVLARDASRMRARRNRGMALAQLGDVGRAAADLEASGAADSDDPVVGGAMALAWSGAGRGADAVQLLRRLRARYPDELGLAVNLARLLVTVEPAAARDPDEALRLAAAANDTTGGRDPRVLDTLATALAATGRRRDAAQAWDAAVSQAEDAGEAALAAELRRRRAAILR